MSMGLVGRVECRVMGIDFSIFYFGSSDFYFLCLCECFEGFL